MKSGARALVPNGTGHILVPTALPRHRSCGPYLYGIGSRCCSHEGRQLPQIRPRGEAMALVFNGMGHPYVPTVRRGK